MIRQLIREMLLEDLAGFKTKTQGMGYESSFNDPTFDDTESLPRKGTAKDIKRAWAAEADHKFMESLIKVHWLPDEITNPKYKDWEEKFHRFMTLGGNNEISTMGYLPGSKSIRSSWGPLGVIVQGRVTLAANDMDSVLSGYLSKSKKHIDKYKSSGIPRRPTAFNPVFSNDYVLDRESYNPEKADNNEFIVDNWKPVGLIADQGGYLIDDVRHTARLQSNEREKQSSYRMAVSLLKYDLPLYDEKMTPIDRKALEEALRGGKG